MLTATLILILSLNAIAQIPPNAVNADPSAKAISQVPLGMNISGNAVLKFKFTNEASSTNSTGQIPANSVRLTISFPGQYAYTSANSIPKFVVEDFDDQAFGVVHLVNNALILEGEVIDLLLNVRGTQTGTGTVTFNTDRVTPIIVANTQTANDNASSSFTTLSILPVSLLSFNAQSNQCTASLTWKTASEQDLDHYDVEVSKDNMGFTKITRVNAASDATLTHTYNTNYEMQGSNPYLFRLKMVDKNGKFTYSYVARINNGCSSVKEVILIYPSPARSSFTLNVTDDALINTKASIYDVNGKRISDFMLTGNTTNVNIEKLLPGIYMVKFSNGANSKFVKN